MSRIARILLTACAALAPPGLAHAQDRPLTAEEALANTHLLTDVNPACAPDSDSDEIVVCGRDDTARHRLPLRAERGPREGERTLTGEMPSASSDPIRTGSCGTLATDTGCTGGLPIIGGAIILVKAVEKLLEPE